MLRECGDICAHSRKTRQISFSADADTDNLEWNFATQAVLISHSFVDSDNHTVDVAAAPQFLSEASNRLRQA